METKLLFINIAIIFLSIAVSLLAYSFIRLYRRLNNIDPYGTQSRMNQKFG